MLSASDGFSLVRARRMGRREYRVLAERHVRKFDHKWLRGGAPKDQRLPGSADLLLFAAALIAPVLPLVLTMFPVNEVFRKLVGILL